MLLIPLGICHGCQKLQKLCRCHRAESPDDTELFLFIHVLHPVKMSVLPDTDSYHG